MSRGPHRQRLYMEIYIRKRAAILIAPPVYHIAAAGAMLKGGARIMNTLFAETLVMPAPEGVRSRHNKLRYPFSAGGTCK